jgi:hypothetical protein
MRKINNGKRRRQQRRELAVKLGEERAERSPAQQLALLDERLGKGVGAKRERARLKRMMSSTAKKKKKKNVKAAKD